jgi:hypothetical protein
MAPGWALPVRENRTLLTSGTTSTESHVFGAGSNDMKARFDAVLTY